jgi:hypothetical protein
MAARNIAHVNEEGKYLLLHKKGRAGSSPFRLRQVAF